MFLVACAAPRPAIGPAAEARAGKDLMADADRRWATFSAAQSDAWKSALEAARAATPPVYGVFDKAPVESGPVTAKREPSWLPQIHRYRIVYSHTISQFQNGFTSTGCGKYRNWLPPSPPPHEPSITDPDLKPLGPEAPSPMPCPPSVPVPVTRSWSATMGLVLEYSEEGKLVAERPTPPAPTSPKPPAPKG